jgi:hypothetical protein
MKYGLALSLQMLRPPDESNPLRLPVDAARYLDGAPPLLVSLDQLLLTYAHCSDNVVRVTTGLPGSMRLTLVGVCCVCCNGPVSRVPTA